MSENSKQQNPKKQKYLNVHENPHHYTNKQEVDEFEYNDTNEIYIGKRTGNRYQKVQEQRHYDGFPRFSDYDTIGSEKSQIQKQSQQLQIMHRSDRTSLRTSLPDSNKLPNNLITIEKQSQDKLAQIDRQITQKQQNTQKQLITETYQRQSTQFEFEDPSNIGQQKQNTGSGDVKTSNERASSRFPNVQYRKNRNFGQISTIKRKNSQNNNRISDIEHYKQIIDNIDEDIMQLDQKIQPSLSNDEQETQKEHQRQKQKKIKKNNRVSFKNNAQIILNKSSIIQQQKTFLQIQNPSQYKQQYYKNSNQHIHQIQENPPCINNAYNQLQVQKQQHKKQQYKKQQYKKQQQKKQQYKKQQQKIHRNQFNKLNRKTKKKKNQKDQRISTRIREEVIRQIKQQQQQSKNGINSTNINKINNKRTKIRVKQTNKQSSYKTKNNRKIQRMPQSKKQQKYDKQEIGAKRYPRRTRVKPVQFWENQKVQYRKGKAVRINNAHLDIAKILGLRDAQNYQINTNITDIESQLIQVNLKYPLSKQLQFTGIQLPFKYLFIKPKAHVSQLKTHQLLKYISITVDDGVKIKQIKPSLQQTQIKLNKWIHIEPNTRFSISAQIADKQDSLNTSDSQNSSKIRNMYANITMQLGKQ